MRYSAALIMVLVLLIPQPIPAITGDALREGGHQGCEAATTANRNARSDISIDGSFTDWTYDDCVYVDYVGNDTYLLNDGYDNSRDLMAAYIRIGGENVYLRADLYDLSIGAEAGYMDLYFMFDLAPGGNTELPDYLDGAWDSGWDLIVAVYDTDHYALYTSSGTLDYGLSVAYNAQWDSVEVSVPMAAFQDAGYSGEANRIDMAVFTARDGTNGGAGEIPDKCDITDAIPNDYPWEDGVLNGAVSATSVASRVLFGLFHHGNQFLKDVKSFIRDDSGMGFWRVPEIHEKWNVPVNLHVSGTLAEGAQWWYPEFNEYLRQLHDNGTAYMVGGFYTEYIPLYVPEEMNLWSMAYAKEQLMRYYNATTDVCWIPERVYWDGWEDLVAQGGYSIVMVDTEDGFRWYAPPGSDEHRVYEAPNGVKILFISNTGQGGAPYNIQDQIHNNYDGGLSITARELCVREALLGERYILYMDDWEKTCGNVPLWGGPEATYAYDNSVGWLAQHQWIKVATLPEIAQLPSAGTIDIDDCTYFWIRQKMYGLNDPATAPTDNWSIYDAWYYDPTDSIEDTDYFSYVPADTDTNLGDWKTPGTQIHDTWELIKGINNTELRTLAFKTMSNMLYETAWYENVWAHNNVLELAYWEKEQAAHIRTAAMYAFADRWLSQPTYISGEEDADLDGSPEYFVANPAMYCLFEARGGKLVFAIDRNGTVLVGNTITGYLDERDAWTDAITSTTTNTHYSGEYLGNAESAGAEYLKGSKVYPFESLGHENDIFQVEVGPPWLGWIRFSLGDEVKNFTLRGGTLSCSFSTATGLRIAASPDLLTLSEEGNMSCVASDGKTVFRNGDAEVEFSEASDVPIHKETLVCWGEVHRTSGVLEMKAPVSITERPFALSPGEGATVKEPVFSWMPEGEGVIVISGDESMNISAMPGKNITLPPGNYTWHVEVNGLSSGEVNFTVVPYLSVQWSLDDKNLSVNVSANAASALRIEGDNGFEHEEGIPAGEWHGDYLLDTGHYNITVSNRWNLTAFSIEVGGQHNDTGGVDNGTGTGGTDNGTGSEGNGSGDDTGGSASPAEETVEVKLTTPLILSPGEREITGTLTGNFTGEPAVTLRAGGKEYQAEVHRENGTWHFSTTINLENSTELDVIVNGEEAASYNLTVEKPRSTEGADRATICRNVIIMYVLPMVVILLIGIALEEAYGRFRKRKD